MITGHLPNTINQLDKSMPVCFIINGNARDDSNRMLFVSRDQLVVISLKVFLL